MSIEKLRAEFVKRFGGSGEGLRVFKSPGRVNLIGEHTDYNGGFVLPAAIELDTTIIAGRIEKRVLRMAATDLDGITEVCLDEIDAYKSLPWGNYQAGIASELMRDGFDLQGCEMLFDDTIPHGGGLSSSAAIEVATALCLATFANEQSALPKKINMIDLALVGQRAERDYIGVSCGIMDQFASAMGKSGHAIFLDCKDLSYRHIPLSLGEKRIVIANTNKKRSLITSKYNERCAECAKALSDLRTALSNVSYLADVSVEQFEEIKGVIKNDTVRNRAQHVIYECDRVKKSAAALSNGDIDTFGKLMNASHESLRYLYEVTGEELDVLVEAAWNTEGCIGSRMTGAGFGGCSVSIVENEAVPEFCAKVEAEYTKKIGYAPSFYITVAGDGGREILI